MIVVYIEGELKYLEYVREYFVKRVKVEFDYVLVFGRINIVVCKIINDNDKESLIRKVSILNLIFILFMFVFFLVYVMNYLVW